MKPKLSTLKKKLWTLTSQYVRLSASDSNGYCSCVTCGLTKHYEEMQAGHFIPRAQGLAVYFELDNIHVQCYRCNINLGGNGAEYYPYMVNKYGQERVDELRRLSDTTVKFSIADYERMIAKMKLKLSDLED